MLTAVIRRTIATVLLATPSLALAEPVWIYVAAEKEKTPRHIEGDIHLPVSAVVARVISQYPSTDTEINLYCRSGSRASIAASALIKAGYTHVQNIGAVKDAVIERGL